MPKSGRALSVRTNVVDDRVLHVGTGAGRHLVQSEKMPHPPRHVVIRARAVTAYAERACHSVAVVKCQPAAEYDDAAECLADEWVLRVAVFGRLTGIKRG